MIRAVIIAALLLSGFLPVQADAALAQKRVTSDQLLKLQNRMDAQRDAYYRFEQAEKEALAEGASDKAALYRQAKVKAHEAYTDLNGQFEKAQAQKGESDRRAAGTPVDSR